MTDRPLARFAALAAAAALDVVLFRPAGDPAADAPDPLAFARGDFAAAIAVQERHGPDLLSIPGVAGTAVTTGPDGRPAVRVYLVRAGVPGLPATLGGHSYLTEVTGAFRALGDAGGTAPPAAASNDTDPKRLFPRPVPIGVSTGQVDVTAGTIAARVVSGDDVFALSNNHVYANRNAAKPGDRILQPGTVDGGVNPDDAIGTLHDFEPIRFCSPFPACPENRIDAAIAATTTDQLGNATPSNGYGTPRSETAAARLGMPVQKYGRTTGPTAGRITGVNATVNVGFRDGTARFAGQIVISADDFSGPGDSGSLVVSGGSGPTARRPVGLLFAGSRTSTLANPIDLVLRRFDVAIDGS
ncbi:MAG: hypothetical protein OXU64_10755 [Gemmatimonadota bacterium]|nr:hypothetical protein [Gemmatimonadota bacterium]